MKDGTLLSWLQSAQFTQVQTKPTTAFPHIRCGGHNSKPLSERATSTAKASRRTAAVQTNARSPTAPRGRGKDKMQRVRRTQLQMQRARDAERGFARVRLPAETTPQSNNNSAPARMPTSSLTPRSSLPDMHPHILPDEQRTAEMQELQEVIPGQQWVRTGKAHILQQLLDETRERKAGAEGMSKQQITMKGKRRSRRNRRKARKGGGKTVVVKSESIDGNPDTRRDSACGSATEFPSGSHPRSPPRRAWTGPRHNSIINIVALCTYPGQTIKPSSFNRLFTLQRRIDAAMNDEGPLRNILRNLPRDITLTVERKEAIWLAQGKLNRVVDERRRSRRRQNLDRYVPSDRWVPIDRYVPGVPYDPNPHMMAMRLFSKTVA